MTAIASGHEEHDMMQYGVSTWVWRAPGSGSINWQEIAQALRGVGYEGPLVIESFTADVKSIARAAAIWRPLASSQDALAADS